MLTLLLIFTLISVVTGVLGLIFRTTFRLIKWFYPVIIAAVAYVFFVFYAVPLMLLIPAALVVCLLFYILVHIL